ncbi:ATP-dependent bile acid permease [Penicillium rolfsii]|nr:ATP-dependent bile acid permease [Penicillium rolfsii]
MPPNIQVASVAAGTVALFLAGVDSIPAIKSIIDRISRRSSHLDEAALAKTAYRDEDGEATPESLKAFSDLWQRVAIAVFSGFGFFVTLSLAILTTLEHETDYLILAWLQLGIWAFLSIQAIAFFTEPRPTSRFVLGQFAFGGSLTALAIAGIQIRFAWDSENFKLREQPWMTLVATQLASALLRALFTVLLPRRPDVFFDGQIVDRELTVTAFGRYTFSWAGSILGYAVKNRTLALTDLPKLRAAKRAERLRAHFERAKKGRKIWKALVYAHWDSLLFQLFLTLIISVLSFGPQMALFHILSSLETRGTDAFNPAQTIAWVLALGGLMLLLSTFEAWLFWAVCSKLFVPIFAELSAVIFAKSMRRKDAKNAKKTKTKDDSETNTKTLLKKQDGDEEEDDEASLKKSRQSIINLAAVDARRISDFTSYAYLIPFASLKVIIGCSFLVKILGWRSAFAGIAVSLLVTPLNIFAAKKYTASQDKLMKLRDQKMAIVTEVLQGIRQIKFSALEEQWQMKISQAREAELGALWISFLYDIVLLGIWILGPIGLSAISLATYALIHGGLSASVAFTAMAVFGALEMSLAILPEIISNGLEAKVSADRIDVYMDSAEKVVNTVPSDSISFEDASVGWPADKAEHEDEDEDEDRFLLRDLNLAFPKKGLSVISGRTGSGKSLLLASILGECDVLQGTIKVPVPPPIKERFDHLATSANWNIDSAIAYVAQIPWIENATIKENILFGLPYNEERYQKTLFACALEKDLEMMPDGELTDIGANGVNLSGGQRWRVSFARALYSRAGILVMDDIFSALDAHTGRHVFEHALTGELGQGRTRVLVTHHVALCLPKTDYSVLLENGCVKYAGTIDDLRKENHLDDILQEESEATEQDQTVLTEESAALNPEETTLQKVISNISRRGPSHAQNNDTTAKPAPPKKFVEDERREVGSVRLSVYAGYFSMGGHILLWLITIAVYLSYSSLMIGRSWWINVWTGSSSSTSSTKVNPEQFSALLQHTMSPVQSTVKDDNLPYYLGVYVGISVLACIIGTARFYFILSASVRASRSLFNRLTFAILRAPLRWLDTVPLGRILNRFTSDFHMIDSRIGYELGFFCSQLLEVCGILVAGILVSPLVLILAGILFVICMKLSMTYLAGAREIKRLESTAKSPVFEQFGSSLAGLITIRAFSKSETFIEIIYGKINAHAQAWWTMWLFNRWLGIRMNLVGAVFSTLTAALVVSLPGISASLAGFALSFALQCNTAIAFVLRQYANIELNMNATERVIEYSKIELENQGGVDAPAAWPTEGRLEVNGLVVGYAPELPPILKGLSFTVEKNQRVGVVGRTGAGKSSLTLALFRFLEAREGQILIDGLDVSKIKLHDLRSRLAIIPQDPVLFSGTVRSNLDPFDEYGDSELKDALARVHLISTSAEDDEATLTSQAATPAQSSVNGATTPDTMTAQQANTNIFTSLSAPISEGGLNLSQGQRQLLCLARAIVARPKIMVLDEATSAVDMETDALIQQSIRTEFGRNATTLLVIAHRLSTIADFDRILVMDAGKAVEFGSPKDLMGIENGVFKDLVDNSGEKDVLEKMIFGEP